jgi:hypothetical protein
MLCNLNLKVKRLLLSFSLNLHCMLVYIFCAHFFENSNGHFSENAFMAYPQKRTNIFFYAKEPILGSEFIKTLRFRSLFDTVASTTI